MLLYYYVDLRIFHFIRSREKSKAFLKNTQVAKLWLYVFQLTRTKTDMILVSVLEV
jgi:hypothetical protein